MLSDLGTQPQPLPVSTIFTCAFLEAEGRLRNPGSLGKGKSKRVVNSILKLEIIFFKNSFRKRNLHLPPDCVDIDSLRKHIQMGEGANLVKFLETFSIFTPSIACVLCILP